MPTSAAYAQYIERATNRDKGHSRSFPGRTRGTLITDEGRETWARSKKSLTHLNLQRLNVRHPVATLNTGDETFSSLRDGEPFVICWNVDITIPPRWATSRPILAHERHGQNGSRYVLTTFANVELLSHEQFAESSFPPGHDPGK